jgi:hypothetical protein
VSEPLQLDTTVYRGDRVRRWNLAFLALAAVPIGIGVARANPLFIYIVWPCVAVFAQWVTKISSWRRTLVRVSAEQVSFGDDEVPRARIASGYFVPGLGLNAPEVRLFDARDREIARINAGNAEIGARILDLLHLGATQQLLVFHAMAPLFPLAALLPLAAGIAYLGVQLHLLWLVPIAALLALVTLFVLGPARIYVGADGLHFKHRFGARFIPWDDVVSIEPSRFGITVHTRSRSHSLPLTWDPRMSRFDTRVTRATLVARARAAHEAYHRDDTLDVAERLARLGRSRDDWLRDLRNVAHQRGDFRAAPVEEDALLRVVESPAASATARAGAAYVLARSGTERERLRIAADACAAPGLRIVLERAAEGADESALHEALAAVEDEAEPETRKMRAGGPT